MVKVFSTFCLVFSCFLIHNSPSKANAMLDSATTVASIVDTARKYIKSSDWAPREELQPIINKAFYCNVFVGDILTEAGAATWEQTDHVAGYPLASEWFNPKRIIKGWSVIYPRDNEKGLSAKEILNLRKPGDVVACRSSGSSHVGIVSDELKALSASSVTGAVEHNEWSFRLPDQRKFTSAADYEVAAKEKVAECTVRRFVGQ